MIKKTTRQFVFAVPNGTTKQRIRTYVRAADGTDYPVDQEIDVPSFTSKTVDYICMPGTERTCENTTEQWALSQEDPGTLAVSSRDFVEILEE